MKRSLKIAMLFIASGWFSIDSGATTFGPAIIRTGGNNNPTFVGCLLTTTTLNAALLIENYDETGDRRADCQAFVWDASAQEWVLSSFDEFSGSWSPNLTIHPGDGIAIQTGTLGFCSNTDTADFYKVFLVGTAYSGGANITIRPGWNLLAAPAGTFINNINLPSPIAGDKHQALIEDMGCLSQCVPTWTTPAPPAVGYWYEPNCGNGPQYVTKGFAFWYYSASGSNRTWSATLDGNP